MKKYMIIKTQIYQNLWDAVKAVHRGKFIAWNAYIRKEERSKITNPRFHFRKLEKEMQIKSRVNRRKEILKIRTKINEIENEINNENLIKSKAGSVKISIRSKSF